MLSQSIYVVRLLNVEHVEKNGKPLMYLVFEFLDTDVKKFVDAHRRGPNPRPLAPNVIQVTLLNDDGVVLSSKYLKLVECVDSGRTCEFPNYLVQICERRNHTRDDTTKPS